LGTTRRKSRERSEQGSGHQQSPTHTPRLGGLAELTLPVVVKILVAPPGQAQRRHPGQVKRTDERG
jgi:hypothetical protein